MHSHKIANPQNVFKNIGVNSFERTLPFRVRNTDPKMPFPGSAAPGSGTSGFVVPARHIQGLVYYDRHDMYIYSHCFDDDAGYLFFAKENDGLLGQIKIINGHKNPGGMQILGDYLFIAIEQPNKRYVLVYDLMTFAGNKSFPQSATIATPRYALNGIDSDSENPASAVGVANLLGNLNYPGAAASVSATDRRWVIGVYDYSESKVSLYFTGTTSEGLESIVSSNQYPFSGNTTIKIAPDRQYDSIALFTDNDDNIWMIGFRGEGSTQFKSYADLFKLTYSNGNTRHPYGKVESIESKQFNTKGNLYHNSFRWGTSFQIKSSTSVLITVSERNLRAFYNSRIEHYY
jgi:hypothetical protein